MARLPEPFRQEGQPGSGLSTTVRHPRAKPDLRDRRGVDEVTLTVRRGDREEEAIRVNLLVDNRAGLVTGSLTGDCGVRAADRELIGLGQEVA
jgi:hypothetical protein